jgi:hypothetical protein
MPPYSRPPIATPRFLDGEGRPIDYGHRWSGSPPEESYSVVTHPERFAPLHTVAEALLEHLRDEYDVELVEGEESAPELPRPAGEVARAVTVRPRDPACAALTIVFTAHPGIFLHAGLLHDFAYPVCGCDACDPGWEEEAERLEQHVLAIAAGGFTERMGAGRPTWVEYAIEFADGASSGRASSSDVAPARLEAAARMLDESSGAWAPWPRRAAPPGRELPAMP